MSGFELRDAFVQRVFTDYKVASPTTVRSRAQRCVPRTSVAAAVVVVATVNSRVVVVVAVVVVAVAVAVAVAVGQTILKTTSI